MISKKAKKIIVALVLAIAWFSLIFWSAIMLLNSPKINPDVNKDKVQQHENQNETQKQEIEKTNQTETQKETNEK